MRVGAESLDFAGRGVNGNDGAGKSGRAQVVQNFSTDLAAFAIGADHRNRSRLEERLHRRGRGQLRPPCGFCDVLRCFFQRQLNVKHAAVHPARHPVTRIEEDVHHLPVLGQHERLEEADAIRSREIREPLEQPRPDAASLQLLGNRERDLGAVAVTRSAVVPRERDDASAALPDQCGSRARVGRDEPSDALRIEPGNGEETIVAALRRQRLEERHQRGNVRRVRGPQHEGRSVAKDDVAQAFIGPHTTPPQPAIPGTVSPSGPPRPGLRKGRQPRATGRD